MPTYTYRCKECGHQFDERQKFSDDALTDCPNCNGRLRRLVNNSAGIVFKGSGFYINDSKSGKGKTSSIGATNKSSENGDTAKGEASTETKNKDSSAKEKKSEPKEKSSSAT